MKILVTGAAGFIGAALSHRLLASGNEVVGLDNLNSYYDVNLKQSRLAPLLQSPRFRFFQYDVIHKENVLSLFKDEKFDKVVHLAAQAGVRYSTVNPYIYVESNMLGFLNILEGSRHNGVKHLIYASTSSVYGAHTNQPFSIHDGADHPVSLYAATKKANELMAHSYSSMYGLPTTGLRFFTVYGPWGRPDMALFLFTKKILNGEPIDVFNFGKCRRDFTYIADIVEGLMRVVQGAPTNPNPAWLSSAPDPATSSAPYAIYNIGNNQSVELMRYIEVIEDCLGKKAKKNFLPPQVGDVESTDADVSDLIRDFHYQPETAIEKGIKNFVLWYREYYGV